MSARSPSPPTERVLDIVGLLAARPEEPLTLTEIAGELGLSLATCHAITSVLVARGALLRSPTGKTFTLGPGLVVIGEAAAQAMPDAVQARSRIAALGATHEAEAVASTVADGAITVVDWSAPPSGEASAHLGQRIPFSPPFGAIHAAWAAPSVVEGWIGRAPAATRDELHRLLATIRRRGYDVHRDDQTSAGFRAALGALEQDALSAAGRDALELLLGELAAGQRLPETFEPRRHYRVNTISAAVRDIHGAPVLTLSLLFHRPLTGAQIARAGADLVDACSGRPIAAAS